MFFALSETLRTWSTPRTILILLGLVIVLGGLFVAVGAQLGGPTPEAHFIGYSAELAFAALEDEGERGRRLHIVLELIDLLLIPAYALLYACTITFGFCRLLGRASALVHLNLVPLLAGLVDYAEDACWLVLLGAFPRVVDGLATLAGILTAAKWALVFASLAVAVVALLGVAIQKAIRFGRARR